MPVMLRLLSLPIVLALAVPAHAEDIPMVAIGLPFAPEAPVPVEAGHPLFHDVAVGPIAGLPATVKSSALNFIAAAKRSSIDAALSRRCAG